MRPSGPCFPSKSPSRPILAKDETQYGPAHGLSATNHDDKNIFDPGDIFAKDGWMRPNYFHNGKKAFRYDIWANKWTQIESMKISR